MPAPTALVIAKVKDSPETIAHLKAVFDGVPQTNLENSERVEMTALRDYLIKSRVRVSEVADHSIFRKSHSATKSFRIMTDLTCDLIDRRDSEVVLVNFLEKIDLSISGLKDYNEASHDGILRICNALQDGGGLGVFLLYIDGERRLILYGTDANLSPGSLLDVGPTFLDLLGLAKPEEMKGTSLLH